MLSIIVVAALAASVALNGVAGDAISLYIPSFDPQPVTVDLLGVGSDGHTTWRVAGGQPSGSITEDNGDIGTITLVEGPSDAELFMSDTLFGYASESCTIGSNSLANCVVVASASGVPLSTETFQETASPIPVQGGTSPAPTAGGSPSTPASAPTAPPTSGSAPSGGPSPTAQTPAGSSPTSAHNGAIGVAASSFLSGVVGIAAAAYLL